MKKIFTLLAIITTTCFFAQIPSYIPTDGLVAYYPFNGNANDESGTGNNGIVNGATLSTDRYGNIGKAYNFNGPNTFITLPNDFFNGNKNENYSINLWVNRKLTNYSDIFHKGGSWKESWINILPNGQVNYIFFGGYTNSPAYNLKSNTLLNLNQWYNISLTSTSGVIKLYINGIFESQIQSNDKLDWSTSINTPCAGVGMHFGKNYNNCTVNDGNYGLIDDFGLWNRALTQVEITNLYQAEVSCQSLVINSGTLSSFNPPVYQNTVTIYPNPASDQITIDCGNLANVSGWNIKISNTLGQEIFSGKMDTQQYTVPLNIWGGKGVYFVKIYDASDTLMNTKKIILQ